ncbi:spore coat U domain-containing protein [Burkholderia pseudomallei]|uniref:Spore Coat Protein U domain protein n=1 Tax=Burkholderia pseudomallei TaxID=28450 RepID=A0A2K9CNS7_BURPE|nr:spore coat protein U domain-containing protein [Burkholderia pseudomallei]KGW50932.1 spore Coat Protein U domain protein [Burkholderia pseudomallei MSHR684]KGX76372.1 spore Coat Protein U domain protein [Burkholderia pseudomallei MSHR435]AGZ26788.1 spore Coat Protein U domain protein [Burkholderia pseudomallei NCTC 13179]AHE27622.1 spore Coat Protein U domain protein [Burkholderia pseudomallei NCTC 13178]AHE33118.1 spore Coat Protein U domain protein [Burkholderia pseudomallei NAU20B-16]
MHKREVQVVSGAAFMLFFATVSAGQLTGTMQVNLQVSRGCEVAGVAASGDLGRLDFGAQGPLWSDYLTADGRATSSGAVRVVCSPDVNGFLVSIDGGRNGDQSTRYLVKRGANGRVAGRIPYNVYRDAARSVPYVPLMPQSFLVDGGRDDVTLPVYGVVNGMTRAVPSGTYEDLLGITLDW